MGETQVFTRTTAARINVFYKEPTYTIPAWEANTTSGLAQVVDRFCQLDIYRLPQGVSLPQYATELIDGISNVQQKRRRAGAKIEQDTLLGVMRTLGDKLDYILYQVDIGNIEFDELEIYTNVQGRDVTIDVVDEQHAHHPLSISVDALFSDPHKQKRFMERARRMSGQDEEDRSTNYASEQNGNPRHTNLDGHSTEDTRPKSAFEVAAQARRARETAQASLTPAQKAVAAFENAMAFPPSQRGAQFTKAARDYRDERQTHTSPVGQQQLTEPEQMAKAFREAGERIQAEQQAANQRPQIVEKTPNPSPEQIKDGIEKGIDAAVQVLEERVSGSKIDAIALLLSLHHACDYPIPKGIKIEWGLQGYNDIFVTVERLSNHMFSYLPFEIANAMTDNLGKTVTSIDVISIIRRLSR